MWRASFSSARQRAARVVVGVALLGLGILGCGLSAAPVASAQGEPQEFQERVRAKVLEVFNEDERGIIGTEATTTVQTLRIELLGGQRAGEVVRLENDVTELAVGNVIFVDRIVGQDDAEHFVFKDIERRPQLLVVSLLFVALVLFFARWQGARALLSLSLSIGAILFVLVPLLLVGYSPALVALGVSGIILALTIFVTHGVNPRSVIAFAGTLTAVAVTCAVAAVSVTTMRMTGFSSDASVYLNFSTGGMLDFTGLLLGSIIIGLLGVLDDVSITQASVVQELRGANRALSARELYARAIRVGRDHVGSLVNTLALAYVGAALPLVMLLARTESSFFLTINQEIVAAEVLRIMIGSIGLILAVPLTTAAAAWYFRDKEVETRKPSHHCGYEH